MTSCLNAPSELDTPSADAPQTQRTDAQATPTGPQPVCDMSKFTFTQASGCVNDGWVEFCATKAGAPVTSALRAIAPDVSIEEGVIGTAGCDEQNDYHVSEPLQASDCTAPQGALTDAKWGVLCALSQLPLTKHFAPGFAQ